MTRVDFYVLPGADPHERRVYACKIAEKAWRQGMKIHIRTGTEADADILDKLLWTFRQGSFIPHEKTDATPAEREDIAVLIGATPAPDDFCDLLINLSLETPPEFRRYARLAEIVDQEETVRAEGRKRYQAYKQQGLELETHKLE
jgi:DNA polymerase-3 subunit chi